MPLITSSGPDPSYLTVVARKKAARECHRPDHDLRLLLAHVRILDILEHSAAELSDPSDDEHEIHHGPEYERKRPSHPKRVSKKVEREELDELDDIFEYEYDDQPKAAEATSMISVEEVEIEDWDA